MRQLVEALYERTDGPLSGEALAAGLGVTRAAVWKGIERLRALGYAVESAPRRGYRLVSAPDTPFDWEVRRGWSPSVVGRDVRYLPEVDSTNLYARSLAAQGAPEGLVVVADRQTAGIGRRGRHWHSPEGGLWFSTLLRPEVPPSEAPVLTFLAGVAVCEGVRRATGVEARLKWPNDVQVDGRKLAGILTEVTGEPDRITWGVVGIGFNAHTPLDRLPDAVRHEATSLAEAADKPVRRVDVLRHLLQALDDAYARWRRLGTAAIMREVRRLSATLGRSVYVYDERRQTEGVAEEIEDDGTLVVVTPGGRRRRVVAGDVSLRTR